MPRRRNQFGKDLATGTYDLIVLDVLRDGPAYVYGIIRRIAEQSRLTMRWREGTTYRVLHHLEEQRLVTSEWRGRDTARPRRYYRLTDRGRRVWRAQRAEWISFRDALDALLCAGKGFSGKAPIPSSGRYPRAQPENAK
jgi:PadR family transcriptional regulator, regulatory protein PadR